VVPKLGFSNQILFPCVSHSVFWDVSANTQFWDISVSTSKKNKFFWEDTNFVVPKFGFFQPNFVPLPFPFPKNEVGPIPFPFPFPFPKIWFFNQILGKFFNQILGKFLNQILGKGNKRERLTKKTSFFGRRGF
jgi:hypothetical protein